MKRVAIPIVNNKLSEDFGACSFYELFEIKDGIVFKNTIKVPELLKPMELPTWLEKLGVTDVIAYRVKKEIISLFASRKVNLFVGVPLHSSKKIIDDYLHGKLESDKKIIEEITT